MKIHVALVAVLLGALLMTSVAVRAQESVELGDPAVVVESPLPGAILTNGTPPIALVLSPAIATGCDTEHGYCAHLMYGRSDVLSWFGEDAVTQGDRIDLVIPSFFAFKEGTHNLTIEYTDVDGIEHTATWSFTVDPNYAPPTDGGISLKQVVVVVAVIFGTTLGGATATYLYFRKTTGITFEKIFARFPIKREAFTIYLPVAIGVAATLAALAFLPERFPENRYLAEQILVVGAVLSLGPFALDTNRALKRRVRAEEAFAQFLFEMADSLRGGIDPVKTLKEMAATQRGLLRNPLKIAAGQLKIGKSFEQALAVLGKRLDSKLVSRYAGLLGEASAVGGDIAPVVYRAAKDMDELVKLELDRIRQLKTPVMTMYIAFGVQFMMVSSMLDFAPTLGSIDISGLMGGGGGRVVPKMPIEELSRGFFHLLLLNAAGAGLLVGSFTQGKLRFGLMHALLLLTVAAFAFPAVAPGAQDVVDATIGGADASDAAADTAAALAPLLAPIGRVFR